MRGCIVNVILDYCGIATTLLITLTPSRASVRISRLLPRDWHAAVERLS